jgi:hypothetical protein
MATLGSSEFLRRKFAVSSFMRSSASGRRARSPDYFSTSALIWRLPKRTWLCNSSTIVGIGIRVLILGLVRVRVIRASAAECKAFSGGCGTAEATDRSDGEYTRRNL